MLRKPPVVVQRLSPPEPRRGRSAHCIPAPPPQRNYLLTKTSVAAAAEARSQRALHSGVACAKRTPPGSRSVCRGRSRGDGAARTVLQRQRDTQRVLDGALRRGAVLSERRGFATQARQA